MEESFSLILTWDVNVKVTPNTIPLNYPHMRFLRLSYDCPSGGTFRNMTRWESVYLVPSDGMMEEEMRTIDGNFFWIN